MVKGRKHQRDWLQQILRRHENGAHPATLHYRVNNFDSNDILYGKALVVAPMVDQSDLPFRLLARKYGSNLCVTPMIHARMFVCNERGYKERFWNVMKGTPAEDRPLIVQFAGGDPEMLAQAAKLVENQCDAVDINCGCPQMIAKRGNYGAFLLENEELLVRCVEETVKACSIPVCVKVRLLPSGLEDSLRLYTRLVDAGAAMLTIHGRNRFNKGPLTGRANWEAIRSVVDALGDRVPILANGSVADLNDCRACLRATGADGIMSAEAVLEYPPIFMESSSHVEITKDGTKIPIRTGPGRLEIAREYMDLVERYPPNKGGQGTGVKCVKMHLHRFLHAELQASIHLRDQACRAKTFDELYQLLDNVETFQKEIGHVKKYEQLAWYMRHRIIDDDGVNISQVRFAKTCIVPEIEIECGQEVSILFGGDDSDY